MDSNAINAIQAKLRRQAEALSQSRVEVPIDWPTANGVKVHRSPTGTTPQGAEFSAAVEMLKQRSTPTFVASQAGQESRRLATGPHPGPTVDPAMYQRRLRLMAERINALSLEQEQAIAEMQRLHGQLVNLEPTWVDQFGEPLTYPAVTFENAATARATLDGQGNLVLAHNPIDPHHLDRAAHQLAHHLRNTYSFSPRPGRRSRQAARWQVPRRWLRQIWPSVQDWPKLGSVYDRLTQQTVDPAPPLSIVDAVLWVIGGILGRLTLALLLAMLPPLGLLAVMAAAIAVIYTLYQATLTPEIDLNRMARLALALGGVAVGGYFGV